MKALILAAGLGTRLKPLTDNKPKALVDVNGKTLLETTIHTLIRFGFNDIIINVHHFAHQIIDFLKLNNNLGINISISHEEEALLDTGGGLKHAAWFFDDGKPFLIHNVDVVTEIDHKKLYNIHVRNNTIATLAVQNRTSTRCFLFDETKNLCGWKNITTDETKITREPQGKLSQLAFSGIHVASPEIFSLMPINSKFSLVDLFLSIASEHRITYFDHTDSLFLDLGKKDNLFKLQKP